MLLIAIAALSFSYYFVNVLDGAMIIKRLLWLDPAQRLKPFDCLTCLSVWTTLLFYFLPKYIIEPIALSFSVGLIAILLSKVKTK
jgi:hypothetical protein